MKASDFKWNCMAIMYLFGCDVAAAVNISKRLNPFSEYSWHQRIRHHTMLWSMHGSGTACADYFFLFLLLFSIFGYAGQSFRLLNCYSELILFASLSCGVVDCRIFIRFPFGTRQSDVMKSLLIGQYLRKLLDNYVFDSGMRLAAW